MPEPGNVLIIHPALGPDSVSEVPQSSLAQHYAAGWRLLADDDIPAAKPEPEPQPMSRAQAAKASKSSEEK